MNGSFRPDTIQIRKDLVLDTRLSFYDKGVYAFMVYNSENPTNIKSFNPKEVRLFASSMRKLVALGYIRTPGENT